MGTFHNFITSTTPTLEGYKINKYLGTVTSHVVTGIGFFSDFAASMSDIFGGRSESYQKQLISIKGEVLKRLKDEATVLGANGIVGLKIDFDEISGKGKAMFMVTAIGTAVQISSIGNKDESESQIKKLSNVTSEILNIEVEKNRLLTFLNISGNKLTKDEWEYITENSLTELFDSVLILVKEMSKSWDETENDSNSLGFLAFEKYLKSLPDEYLIENIYKMFFTDQNKIRELAYSLIKERDLLNLPRIKKILNLDNLMAKKFSLKTLYNCDKRIYSIEDITEFEEIKKLARKNFPEIGERLSKKKLMSSEQKEAWICPHCKKENSEVEKFCKKCGCDIRGFYEKEIFPEDVIEDIDNKLEVLKKLLFQ